jgi:chaperonin GroES
MPIYEYRCSKCGKDFELMRPFSQSNESALCPDCGAAGERMISVFASTVEFGIQVPAKQPLKEAYMPTKVKSATKLQPLGDRIVVRPIKGEEVTKGGIIIPDTAKEKPQVGEVIAVGPGKITVDGKRLAMEVEKGDKVMYAKYGGTEIKIDDEELLILRDSDVLAKIS